MGSSRWRAGAALVALGLGVASCSSEPQSTAPTVELSTTSVTTLPTTTTAPPSTEAPTTTEDPRIAEVEAAVAAFHDAQLAVLLEGGEIEALSSVASDPLLEELTGNIAMARADGRSFAGSFESQVVSTVALSDDVFLHTACVFDRVVVLGADGSEIVPADEGSVLVEYEVVEDGGIWVPRSFSFPGGTETSCELR